MSRDEREEYNNYNESRKAERPKREKKKLSSEKKVFIQQKHQKISGNSNVRHLKKESFPIVDISKQLGEQFHLFENGAVPFMDGENALNDFKSDLQQNNQIRIFSQTTNSKYQEFLQNVNINKVQEAEPKLRMKSKSRHRERSHSNSKRQKQRNEQQIYVKKQPEFIELEDNQKKMVHESAKEKPVRNEMKDNCSFERSTRNQKDQNKKKKENLKNIKHKNQIQSSGEKILNLPSSHFIEYFRDNAKTPLEIQLSLDVPQLSHEINGLNANEIFLRKINLDQLNTESQRQGNSEWQPYGNLLGRKQEYKYEEPIEKHFRVPQPQYIETVEPNKCIFLQLPSQGDASKGNERMQVPLLDSNQNRRTEEGMRAEPERIPTIVCVDEEDLDTQVYAIEARSEGGSAVPRVQVPIKWFIPLVVCMGLLPVFDMLLVYAYPFAIDKGPKVGLKYETLPSIVDNASADLSGYYVVIFALLAATIVFIAYNLTLGEWKQRMRLYFMLDTILIIQISSAMSFAALHVEYFCSNFFNDQNNPNSGPPFVVVAADVFVIFAYVVSNFTAVATIRTLLVYTILPRWKVLALKLTIMLSSLTFIAVGAVFLFGSDSASLAYRLHRDQVYAIMTTLNPIQNNPQFVQKLRSLVNLSQFINNVQNFMLLYVFTNFAFLTEVFKKLCDFDGSSDLKSNYEVGTKQRNANSNSSQHS